MSAASQSEGAQYTGLKSRPRLLLWIERLFLLVEKPVIRALGTGLLNPLYATGPIAVFLLIILGITGLYVTLFYDFSFEASYPAVARMNLLLVSRFMRAIHRYASDIFIITVVIHALRTFFTDRFRRPYWLAWVTGVLMLGLALLAGITGYWMIWDENALEMMRSLVGLVARWMPDGENLATLLMALGPRQASWAFMLSLFAVHLLAFLVMAVFIWLHVRRLQRPAYLPRVHWYYITFVTLFVVAAAIPAYLLPKADFTVLPARLRADLLYLLFLPARFAGVGPWFWLGSLVLFVVLAVLPWLSRPPAALPQVTIVTEKCTGCHLCALDCPYKAIEMVPREDGPYKFVAVVHEDLCVSCSVCLGSCDDDALYWGDFSVRLMAEQVARWVGHVRSAHAEARVKAVFACERHVDHAAGSYVGREIVREVEGGSVITLTTGVRCAGALHPEVLTAALDAGADEVVVVGCPPDDCAHRQGNQWLQERLDRTRAPHLNKAYEGRPIRTAWVPPNMFEEAVFEREERRRAWGILPRLSGRSIRVLPPGGIKRVALAIALMAMPLLVLIALVHQWFPAYPPEAAYLEIVIDNPVERLRSGALRALLAEQGGAPRLLVEVDGQVLLHREIERDHLRERHADAIFHVLPVVPGRHHIRVRIVDTRRHVGVTLFDRTLEVGARRVALVYFLAYSEK